MRYSAERYEVLFDQKLEQDKELTRKEWASRLGHKPGWKYRTKRIEAGDIVELECYPVYDSQREASRAKKAKPTEEAMRNQNQKNARKRLNRLMNANFTPEDLFLTCSYKGAQPTTLEDARKDVTAFLRRAKRWLERNGYPELKYIYTIEYAQEGKAKRIHHHIAMTGMPRDEAEKLWGHGRCNANRMQPDEFGLEGLARYFVKTQGQRARGERLWSCSRNLEQPKVTYSDRKIGIRAVEHGAADEAAIREVIRRKEPDCIINDITIRRSDHVAGAYISVRMRKAPTRGSPPTDRAETTGRPRPQRRKP